MTKKLLYINIKILTVLILCFAMMFPTMAPIAMATIEKTIEEPEKEIQKYEEDREISGEVLDFSNRKVFNFETKTKYGDLTEKGYEISKNGSDYTIKLNNLTAKKIILPPDDADDNDIENGVTELSKKGGKIVDRKTHITIELIGSNKVIGYGISGYYVKGLTITGEGTLDVTTYSEPKIEKEKDDNEKVVYYTKHGIFIETDEIKEDDPNSGFIIDANVTVDTKEYWGITCNGEIKVKENKTLNVTGKGKIENHKDGAISADRLYKEGNAKVNVVGGTYIYKASTDTKGTYYSGNNIGNNENNIKEEKSDVPASKPTSKPPVISGVLSDGTPIRENEIYCENPVITVTAEKTITNIEVNKIGGIRGITGTFTNQTFNIPKCVGDGEKIIEVTDADGNTSTFKFTSYSNHKEKKTIVNKVEATCISNGYYTIKKECEICNKLLGTETITSKALGHNLVTKTTNENVIKCTRCSYTETIPTSTLKSAPRLAQKPVQGPTTTETPAPVQTSVPAPTPAPVETPEPAPTPVPTPVQTSEPKETKKEKITNAITASNITKNYSKKAQSFKINAKQKGNARLIYISNNKNVIVNSAGKVTITKGFIGKATITITAKETQEYSKATKKITITVKAPTIKISKLSNTSKKKMTIKWSKNTAVTGYQIQYSTDKNFKKGVKTVTINKNNTTSKSVAKLSKNKRYYVRIRSYKTVSGVKYYSNWSSVRNIKIKK